MLENLMSEAGPWYAIPERSYHNWGHALSVYRTLLQINPDASPRLHLAAIWHDAVYIPGSTLNEKASADALQYAARRRVELQDVAADTATLILCTDVTTHLTPSQIRGDLAYLLDSDLHSLGAEDYCKFWETQEAIVAEHLPNKNTPGYSALQQEVRRKQAGFLHHLRSQRKYLFHTSEARELFEVNAHNNILRLYKELVP